MKKPRLTFRKDPPQRYSAQTYTVSLAGQSVAKIQECDRHRPEAGWFTYNWGKHPNRFNTSATPASLEAVKDALIQRFTPTDTPTP